MPIGIVGKAFLLRGKSGSQNGYGRRTGGSGQGNVGHRVGYKFYRYSGELKFKNRQHYPTVSRWSGSCKVVVGRWEAEASVRSQVLGV